MNTARNSIKISLFLISALQNSILIWRTKTKFCCFQRNNGLLEYGCRKFKKNVWACTKHCIQLIQKIHIKANLYTEKTKRRIISDIFPSIAFPEYQIHNFLAFFESPNLLEDRKRDPSVHWVRSKIEREEKLSEYELIDNKTGDLEKNSKALQRHLPTVRNFDNDLLKMFISAR